MGCAYNRASIISLGALFASTALTGGALASAPDLPAGCTDKNFAATNATVVCQGNLPNGAAVPGTVTVTQNGVSKEKVVESVTVNNLTSGVTGGTFSLLSQTRAGDVPVSLSVDLGDQTQTGGRPQLMFGRVLPTGDAGLSAGTLNGAFVGTGTQNQAHPMILMQSSGINGRQGQSANKNGNGKPGQVGGSGGDINLILGQAGRTTVLTNDNASATAGTVVIMSNGSFGGAGSDGSTYFGTAFQTNGGPGALGGSGGDVFLSADGPVQMTSRGVEPLISLSSTGDFGGKGGDAKRLDELGGKGTGGRGGNGGTGGTVLLDIASSGETSTGSWHLTQNHTAPAISAISTGGRGGNAGTAGRGDNNPAGVGGAGGQVGVGFGYRKIELNAENAVAAELYGIGGLGGNGGPAGSGGKPSNGGDGGVGSRITVRGAWSVDSTADGTRGIVAMSTGGAGGGGGGNYSTARNGGSGGNGGVVAMGVNAPPSSAGAEAKHSTISTGAAGVILVSQGGKGGVGNDVSSIEVRPGGGGAGGDGGAVSFGQLPNGDLSTAPLTVTAGSGSRGAVILGSYGGEGGTPSPNSGTGGGRGGSGGDAGPLTLVAGNISATDGTSATPALTLTSTANGAKTLFLKSEGGAGINGANVNSLIDQNGGSGGTGGNGGTIYVPSLDANITAPGSQGAALWLETLGGAGGNGGASATQQGGGTASGGQGGQGGNGGNIYLSTSADNTLSSQSYAVYAASIGRRGGNGGRGNQFGGNGAPGGSAGIVSFNVDADGAVGTGTWTLSTEAAGGVALSLTSRGGTGGNGEIAGIRKTGSGGTGRSARDVTVRGATVSIDAGQGAAAQIASIGGNGGSGARNIQTGSDGGTGAGGNGGNAGSVEFDGSFTVHDGATGVSLQSMAGRGGDGGYFTRAGSSGKAGIGGVGGTSQSISITTSDTMQVTVIGPGITALSQGGAGGNGGGASGTDVGFAGAGGAGGNAGTLSLTSAEADGEGSWRVTTTGDDAPGISLSSIGGASGSGGVAGRDRQTTGRSGSGDDVTVSDATLTISTKGNQSPGLYLLSKSGTGLGELGSSGSIVATGTFDISTTGAQSPGIDALATNPGGGGASSGSVTVNLSGGSQGVSATGAGSHGIKAASSGSNVQTVSITVPTSATITGGAKAAASTDPDGSGVFVADGTSQNTLVNAGTIQSVLGTSGVAITYDGSASLGVNNQSGTVTGCVINVTSSGLTPCDSDQSARTSLDTSDFDAAFLVTAAATTGSITFVNGRGGVVNAGARVDTTEFTNAGRFSPGGDGVAAPTVIDGNFKQTRAGTLAIDVSAQDGAIDRVGVTGKAKVDGTVEVSLSGFDTPMLGEHRQTILSAQEGLTVEESLAVTQSIVARYRLIEEANRLVVGFDIDFANDEATSKINDNQTNIAGYLQDLYEVGLIDTDLAQDLVALEDAQDYARFVNNMSAEVALDNQIAAVQAFHAFQKQLLSCADASGPGALRFLDDGQCVFASTRGAGFKRDGTSDNLGFSGSSWSVSGGGQFAVGEDWTIGGALGYEWRQLDVSGASASSDGQSVFAGVSVKRHFGALEFGASSSLGYGAYDIDRQPLPGASVEADQNVWSLGGRVRAAYVFGSETVFIEPRVDLGVDHVFGSSFSESGPTGTRLLVDTDDETYVSLTPAVKFGGEVTAFDGMRFRPNMTVGITQYINNPGPSLTARFAEAGTVVDGFDASTDVATTFVDLSGGVDVFAKDYAVLRAGTFTRLSRDDTIYGGSLRLEVPF
ncbi:MAG: autotransporter outer membrane beta-barrel domain-containing protein [Pseudomonadota bacterium]